MIVIMNPPYGNKGTTAAQITEKVLQLASQIILLSPKTSMRYMDDQTFSKMVSHGDFFRGEDVFEGASFTSKLVVSLFSKDNNKRLYKDYIEFVGSQNSVFLNYKKFQDSHPINVKEIPLTFSTWHFTDEQVVDFTKDLPRERLFVRTQRNIADGVHKRGFDIEYNLHGAPFQKQTDCVGYIFETKEERDNYTKWYYSTGKKGLAHYLSKMLHAAGTKVKIWFPHVDWTIEQTDESIIKYLKENGGLGDGWDFDDFE